MVESWSGDFAVPALKTSLMSHPHGFSPKLPRAITRSEECFVFVLGAAVLLVCSCFVNVGVAESSHIEEFLSANCLDCHEGEGSEGGLDLELLSSDLSDAVAMRTWVRIHDRIRDGEMPPKDHSTLEVDVAAKFLKEVALQIRHRETEQRDMRGRVVGRRLTRIQIERSLQDLLGIDIPLADQLPEESRANRYSTVADGQAMSHFQLQSHLAVVDLALDEAFRRALSTEDSFEREFDARGLARTNPNRRCREPEMRNDQAVIWNGAVIFYGRIPATTAPEDGWYRFELQVSALKPPKTGGVWSTVRTGLCVSSAPLLTHVTSFEATPEPRTIKFEAWLPKGHMLEIRPGDVTLKRGRFAGGQIGTGEGEPQDIPGIAFDWLTMKRFHRGFHRGLQLGFHRVADDDEVRRRLFGDLAGKLNDNIDALEIADGFSNTTTEEDVERLLRNFARRAFREPVGEEILRPYLQPYLQPYLNSVKSALADGAPFHEALRLGYRAILCSPRFLYFKELPGKLNPHAVASRLSYFLNGTTPDGELASLADSGALSKPHVLREQTERLLSKSDGMPFSRDFAAEWLDFERLSDSSIDRKLYGEFDPVVELSMVEETHAFLQSLLRENRSVVRLVDADFSFLNSRLARYYGIEDVRGDELRRVSLPPQSHRAGLLTHGSVLRVTANGSNTSPVVRGVWVSERLLGLPIPPPPASVPAIEPDIRGATTIREQLAKHRSDDSCAGCHTKIDPAGFALENFDAAGQWRDVYRKKGKNKAPIEIDASYELPDGRRFENIHDFRQLVAAEPRKLARNVVEQLLVYGTGAPIGFSDRQAVDSIVDEVADDNFGFRSIIHAVVSSPIFLSK